MKETTVIKIKDVELHRPIMVEGLPGIGHVGKLVADHLVEELKAEKFIEIYSPHLPPQVLVNKDGTIRLVRIEFYAWKSNSTKANDLIIVVGDYQSTSNVGHYEISGIILELALKYNVQRIYTLGGYGIGQLVEEPVVIGAVNNPKLIAEMKQLGVLFKENEPGGGIIGASGLLLGLAQLKGLDAICLMGETSGYLVDPKSAQKVLNVLTKALGIKVSMQAMEDRARDMEKIVAKLREMEQAKLMPELPPTEEDLRYIR